MTVNQAKKKLKIEVIEEKIDSLPVLPSVVCELILLSHESHDFFEKVGELTLRAPLLAARVLSFANSAASASSKPITSIEDALIRLGVIKTLSLITIVSISKIVPPSKSTHKEIWSHSLETAHLCKHLAESVDDFSVDKELAYLCGLLHDIGRFVFLQISPKIIDVIDVHVWNKATELPGVENQLFGFTHADVGYLAAKKWNFPEIITQVIQKHHRYDLWQINEGSVEFRQLITIVQLADSISVFMQKNQAWQDWPDTELKDRITNECIHKNWPITNFNLDSLITCMPKLKLECNEILKGMGI